MHLRISLSVQDFLIVDVDDQILLSVSFMC